MSLQRFVRKRLVSTVLAIATSMAISSTVIAAGETVDLRASAEGKVIERFPVVGSKVHIHGDLTADVTSCTGTLRQWVEGHQDPFNDATTVADSSYTTPGSAYQQTQAQAKTVVYAMQAPDGSADQASCTLVNGATENRKVDRLRVEWVEAQRRPIIDWLATVEDWPGGVLAATLAFPALLALSVSFATGSIAWAGASFLVAFGLLSAVVGLSLLALAVVIVVAIGFGMTYSILGKV